MPITFRLTYVQEATEDPVDVGEFKHHERLSGNAEDVLIASKIRSATMFLQKLWNQQFVTASLLWTMDAFPFDGQRHHRLYQVIRMPRSPLQSITSINYVDTQGNAQVLDPTTYLVDTGGQPGRIAPAFSKIWPVARTQLAAVTITFVAGYGTAMQCPLAVKDTIMLLAGALYQNREDSPEIAWGKVGGLAERVMAGVDQGGYY